MFALHLERAEVDSVLESSLLLSGIQCLILYQILIFMKEMLSFALLGIVAFEGDEVVDFVDVSGEDARIEGNGTRDVLFDFCTIVEGFLAREYTCVCSFEIPSILHLLFWYSAKVIQCWRFHSMQTPIPVN